MDTLPINAILLLQGTSAIARNKSYVGICFGTSTTVVSFAFFDSNSSRIKVEIGEDLGAKYYNSSLMDASNGFRIRNPKDYGSKDIQDR